MPPSAGGKVANGPAFPEERASIHQRRVEVLSPGSRSPVLAVAVELRAGRGAEPTNTVPDRAHRLTVLWRKGSFGSHSPAGSRFAMRMLTLTPCVGRRPERG